MVRGGASWSGRERNCAFLNLDGHRFANISGISGLDWLDDGRSLAACDWDQDGDLDLWFKNRTGPQLRFMENTGTSGNFISLRLVGSDCNTDALGARVEVWASGRRLVQTVQAGSGYLAQSSTSLHFGLGTATEIDRIEVQWPGGKTETLPPAAVGYHHRYRQGSGQLESRPAKHQAPINTQRQAASPIPPDPGNGNRIILRQPFPLPENWLGDDIDSYQGFSLVTFWAQWCPICRTELSEFSNHKDRLSQEGIRIVLLNLDATSDQAKARTASQNLDLESDFHSMNQSQSTLISGVLRSALDLYGEIPIPMNLLLDPKGNIVLIYQGPVSIDVLINDRRAANNKTSASPPSGSGRWFSPASRHYLDLVNDLKTAGLLDWARFYLKLDRQAAGR